MQASLPLAKLCAVVTMQKQGEANIQTFSLPLRVLAGNDVDNMQQDKVQDTGLLDITIKYQQVKTEHPSGRRTAQMEDNNQVCLSLKVFQACGLKVKCLAHFITVQIIIYLRSFGGKYCIIKDGTQTHYVTADKMLYVILLNS